MLRFFLLFLIVFNAALWGWQQGWFGDVPNSEGREPERLTKQYQPGIIQARKYTSPSQMQQTMSSEPEQSKASTAENSSEEGDDANDNRSSESGNNDSSGADTAETASSSLPAETPASTIQDSNVVLRCIESGPLNFQQTEQFRTSIANILPEKEMWRLDVQSKTTRWAVYLGKFPSEKDALTRKSELANMGLVTEIIRNNPRYEPGLSFDMFTSKSNAQRRLTEVKSKGINDAQIVPWKEDPIGQLLHVPKATAKQEEQLNKLATEIGAPAFRVCNTDSN